MPTTPPPQLTVNDRPSPLSVPVVAPPDALTATSGSYRAAVVSSIIFGVLALLYIESALEEQPRLHSDTGRPENSETRKETP